LFACIFVPHPASTGRTLVDLAREFSSRVEEWHDWLVLLDVGGLGRMNGHARTIGLELGRASLRRGWAPRVAVAPTRMAALVMAHARPGLTIVAPGDEARLLAPVPIQVLEDLWELQGSAIANQQSAISNQQSAFATLRRWGVRTLGELTALPSADLSARLGPDGPVLQRIARGEDLRPLVPVQDPERFEAACDLEWPIEGLEPLSFVLARLLEPLCARLERADRGAAAFAVRLTLTTRDIHERVLPLPAPVRDPRALRTLALLDLESHPPPAGVDRVAVAIEPMPGRVTQYSLIEYPRPAPEQLSTLVARLSALMGEGRSGAPALVDTHRPGAFEVAPFEPDRVKERGTRDEGREQGLGNCRLLIADCRLTEEQGANDQRLAPGVLRRFRVPVLARVALQEGRPVRMTTARRGLAGGRVSEWAGPWRTSGDWWSSAWDRDEWDILAADGIVYCLFRDRAQDRWFVEGIID
jgi:protein ImuB